MRNFTKNIGKIVCRVYPDLWVYQIDKVNNAYEVFYSTDLLEVWWPDIHDARLRSSTTNIRKILKSLVIFVEEHIHENISVSSYQKDIHDYIQHEKISNLHIRKYM